MSRLGRHLTVREPLSAAHPPARPPVRPHEELCRESGSSASNGGWEPPPPPLERPPPRAVGLHFFPPSPAQPLPSPYLPSLRPAAPAAASFSLRLPSISVPFLLQFLLPTIPSLMHTVTLFLRPACAYTASQV